MEMIVVTSSTIAVCYGILAFMVVMIIYFKDSLLRCKNIKVDWFFRIIFGMIGVIFLISGWLLLIAAQLSLTQDERVPSLCYMLAFILDLIFYYRSIVEAVR